MTTTYKFKTWYTKLGISATPTSAPTVDIVDVTADSKLVTSGSTVSKTNLVGYYEYVYSGSDGLDLIALFHTTDTTIDQQDWTSYTPDILTTNLNTTISSRASSSLTASGSTLALIPTNPLLTNDSRIPATIIASASQIISASTVAESVSSSIIEGTITLKQALQLLLSVMAGKVSGGGTTTITFRDTGDGTNRVIATVDSNGNRSAITLNPT
jgi:hypothetical protein